MATFEYKVKEDGKVVSKTTVAGDRYTLMEDLRKSGVDLISVQEKKTKKFSFRALNEAMVNVKLREKIVFARNLSAMVEAGLSISRALEILNRQTKNPKLKKILTDIASQIEKGGTLSGGLKKYPKVFPELFCAMVEAGEQSGTMAESLETVGTQLEKSYNLRKKIKGAMIYPSIVISAMFVIGVLMFIFVVPTLTSTFKSLGAKLPVSTQIIIVISDFMAAHTVLTILLIIVVVAGAYGYLKTKNGKRVMDFTLLRFPVIKNIVKESNAAYMSRTLSSLLSSGVDMVEALQITEHVVGNSYCREVVVTAGERVQKGEPLHRSFQENEKLYPLLVGEMIEVGEETGELNNMLSRLADFYENEVEIATKDMSTIVEPILMLVIASAVGFFAVSMITPIYSLSSSIG